MGCFCSKSDDESEDVELSNTMISAVICRSGPAGSKVQVTKSEDNSAYTVTGSGTLVGSCALECDTAYWEVKIGKNPKNIRIGVKRYQAKKGTSLEGVLGGTAAAQQSQKQPTTESAWFMPPMGGPEGVDLKEGDVVGVFWDQTDLPMLSFSLNGGVLPGTTATTRIRPTYEIFPAVSVDDGASCELFFDGAYFTHKPPSSKFKMIVCATSLI